MKTLQSLNALMQRKALRDRLQIEICYDPESDGENAGRWYAEIHDLETGDDLQVYDATTFCEVVERVRDDILSEILNEG
jgi:hypothetical protein